MIELLKLSKALSKHETQYEIVFFTRTSVLLEEAEHPLNTQICYEK